MVVVSSHPKLENTEISMDASTSHCNRLLVAAIDFGTTFSGYAFSFRDKPLEIITNQSWGSGSHQLITLKTPTSVLLKPNKEFHSFGFEAENKYSDLAEDDEHHGWYLFRRFKMTLYETKDLRMDTQIEDLSGKKMPALTIFSLSIRYLNEHLLKTLNNQTIGITANDIQYVITVPAIWDQKAKQFMRKAAMQGGIPGEQLRLALEPEAASIWCQVATDQTLCGLAKAGSKYMVVDLGGGTADITVHEKLPNGTLKEIHKASGGSWGGVQVDRAYLEMLKQVFGGVAMKKFKAKHIGDYFDLLRDFEAKKRTITSDTDGKMTFKVPATLKNCAETKQKSMEDIIVVSPLRGKMIWSGDKIRVEKAVPKQLFDETIGEITRHVKELLSKPHISDVDAVMLVGGFGECQLVREAFEKSISCKLITPADAGLVVLKGAVRFGHLPEIVSVRVAQFTYGQETCPYFDAQLHDCEKKTNFGGKDVCNEVFHKFVTVGEEIPLGREIHCIGHAIYAGQTAGVIKIYSSKRENPKYVTEECCSLLGIIEIDYPENNDVKDTENDVYITFGDTELKVRVIVRKTNKHYEKVIDCFD